MPRAIPSTYPCSNIQTVSCTSVGVSIPSSFSRTDQGWDSPACTIKMSLWAALSLIDDKVASLVFEAQPNQCTGVVRQTLSITATNPDQYVESTLLVPSTEIKTPLSTSKNVTVTAQNVKDVGAYVSYTEMYTPAKGKFKSNVNFEPSDFPSYIKLQVDGNKVTFQYSPKTAENTMELLVGVGDEIGGGTPRQTLKFSIDYTPPKDKGTAASTIHHHGWLCSILALFMMCFILN